MNTTQAVEVRGPDVTPGSNRPAVEARRVVEAGGSERAKSGRAGTGHGADGAAATRRPAGVVRWIVSAIADAGQPPATGHRLLLGPNGGLHWTSPLDRS